MNDAELILYIFGMILLIGVLAFCLCAMMAANHTMSDDYDEHLRDNADRAEEDKLDV